MPNDLFMTTSEVADLTRSPESTIRYWRHIGVGPRWVRLRRRVVYRRSDVLEWIENQYMSAS